MIAERQTENITLCMDNFSKKAKIKREKHEKLLNEAKKNLTLLERDFRDEVETRMGNCQRIKEDIEQ